MIEFLLILNFKFLPENEILSHFFKMTLECGTIFLTERLYVLWQVIKIG